MLDNIKSPICPNLIGYLNFRIIYKLSKTSKPPELRLSSKNWKSEFFGVWNVLSCINFRAIGAEKLFSQGQNTDKNNYGY